MGSNFASWALSPVDYDEDQPLLIDAATPERSLSFKQLRQQVLRLLAGLESIGVQSGDSVCVNAFNDIQWNTLYLGIIGAGAIFTGVNPGYSVHELVDHFEMVEAKVLIVEPAMLDKTLAAAKRYGMATSRIYAFDVYEPSVHPEVRSWSTLLQYGEGEFAPCPNPETTVAAYLTTSGTSGLPKAAMIPHAYLIAQGRLRVNKDIVDYKVRRLMALPPMHAFAGPIVPASLRQGAPTYIFRRYDQAEFISAIEKYQITETYLAPPVLVAITKSHLASKSALRSLRQIWFGGAAVTHENRLPLYDLLHPDARINPVWGMTETGWNTTAAWPKKQMDSSVGTPLEIYDVRVVDSSGNVLKQKHAIGELQIFSPSPMLGYLNNPEATREAFTIDQGVRWVNTGDIGYADAGNNIFVIDRKKDLIKIRGWQVSPGEVEGRLLQHPDVVDVGVIGVTLPNGEGELCRAYVSRKPDSRLTIDELKKFAAVELARYKCPEEIIFVGSVPRNPTGKILRRILREKADRPTIKHSRRLSMRNMCLASVSLGVMFSVYWTTISGLSHIRLSLLTPIRSIQGHVISLLWGY